VENKTPLVGSKRCGRRCALGLMMDDSSSRPYRLTKLRLAVTKSLPYFISSFMTNNSRIRVHLCCRTIQRGPCAIMSIAFLAFYIV